MSDDQEILVVAAFGEHLLEVEKRSLRGERVREKNLGLVAGLGSDERGGLEAPLERAGYDEIELNLQRVEDVGKVQALPLPILVERAFDIEQRVRPPQTG
jgi:hypothetical protein